MVKVVHFVSCMKVLITQSCLTLFNPTDCSLPSSSVHGILQARVLEWVPFTSPGNHPNPRIEPGSPALLTDSLLSEQPGELCVIYTCHSIKKIKKKWSNFSQHLLTTSGVSNSNIHRKKERKWSCSVVSDSVTPWTVAQQGPLSMGFSRQEYCSGLPFPSPGDLPNPGIEPRSPTLQADTLPSEPPGKPKRLWATAPQPSQDSPLQEGGAVCQEEWKFWIFRWNLWTLQIGN